MTTDNMPRLRNIEEIKLTWSQEQTVFLRENHEVLSLQKTGRDLYLWILQDMDSEMKSFRIKSHCSPSYITGDVPKHIGTIIFDYNARHYFIEPD